jgi:hypothetical protein
MGWIIYFGIALISLENDAITCHILKMRLRLGNAIVCALFWPLTSLLVIGSVIREQNRGLARINSTYDRIKR